MADRVTKKYTDDFKKQWVERYLQGGATLKAVAQEAKIRSETLSGWAKAYEKTHPAATPSTPKKAPAAKSAVKKAKPRVATTFPSKQKTADSEVEQLRRDLKAALEENTTLKRAMRFLFASST